MTNTFKSKKSKGIGTALSQVGSYTVAANTTATVIGLVLCNTSSNTISVSASQYDGTTDYYILSTATLVVGGSIAIAGGDQKLVLQAGEGIRVNCSQANSVDVVMTILETA